MRQDSREISIDELLRFQQGPGFRKYILDVGEVSSFEEELLTSGIECVLYEGMVNGVYGKNLDRFGFARRCNRVQAPFIQTSNGDNVVWRYKQELEQQYGREFLLESQTLYDDFTLEILKRSFREGRIFSRELDLNGRFKSFEKPRVSREEDFDDFCEYLDLVKLNSSENKSTGIRKSYPQLSLDALNMVVFVSQLRNGNNKAGFLGGPVSNEYMPKGFRSMEKLYRNKLLSNCNDLLPNVCDLTLYDASIGRGKNT